jgi:hypothetical protein
MASGQDDLKETIAIISALRAGEPALAKRLIYQLSNPSAAIECAVALAAHLADMIDDQTRRDNGGDLLEGGVLALFGVGPASS